MTVYLSKESLFKKFKKKQIYTIIYFGGFKVHKSLYK